MKYYLGIDGGGTRTVAVVGDDGGNILFKAEGGSINFYSVGMEASRHNLSDVMCKINIALGDITFESAFVGCSALDGRASDEVTTALCGGIINSAGITMDSDVYVALKASECDAVAICGTGSMAVGQRNNGELVVKGGWGHVLGDEGSAYSIAVGGLRHICRATDSGSEDSLLPEIKAYFDIPSVRDIIDIIYSPDVNKDYIAGFGARIGNLADSGDALSREIISSEAVSFAETVLCLLDELENAGKLSLYGGVFVNCNSFKTCFCQEIKARYPELEILLLETPPECGALNLARGMYE